MPLPCHFCLKWSPENRRCAKCEGVYYCGRACQTKDWKREDDKEKNVVGHRTYCKKPPPLSSHFYAPVDYAVEYSNAFPKDPDRDRDVKDLSSKVKEIGDQAFLWIQMPQLALRNELWVYNSNEGLVKVTMKKRNDAKGKPIGHVLPKVFDGIYSELMVLRNHPPIRLRCRLGETYVGVGFVDIVQLLLSDIEEDEKPDKTSSTPVGAIKPLRYVGIDSSLNVIARAHVVYEMMKDRTTSSKSILQVLFSTCLDEEASKSFRMACRRLLDEENVDQDVKKVVFSWIRLEISIEDACQEYRKLQVFQGKIMRLLDSLRNWNDRMDYARYMFKGIIFVDESRVIMGNPSFFLPGGRFHYRAGIFFFGQIDLDCLKDYETSLFKTIERYFTARMDNLCQRVRSGKVVCTFIHKMIGMVDPAEADELRSLDPAVIDWSNVPDFFDAGQFLSWAQKCGTDKTLHTLHLMNWQALVYGAEARDVLDLSGESVKPMEVLVKTYISARNVIYMDRVREFASRPYLEKFLLKGVSYFFLFALDKVFHDYFKTSFIAHMEEESRKEGRAKIAKVSSDRAWQILFRDDTSSFDLALASRNLSPEERKELVEKNVMF